jgi:rod shape-determining protein MreB
MFTGGVAKLKNIDKLIREITDLPVHIAEDPLTAVVSGTGPISEDLHHHRTVIT